MHISYHISNNIYSYLKFMMFLNMSKVLFIVILEVAKIISINFFLSPQKYNILKHAILNFFSNIIIANE